MLSRGRFRRAMAVGLAVLAVAVAIGAALLRTQPVRDWTGSVTGEENAWEALKGVVALALLQATGRDLDLEPDAPIEHLGLGRLGVNTFLQLEAEPENVRKSFAAMRDAGVSWARQQFPWEDIEIHGKGDFEDRRNRPSRSAWTKYDRIVRLAGEHGVQLLVRLDDPPDWAFADPVASGGMGPPDDLEDYADFVAAVARRYCPRVRYYQIWNEPNIYPEWGERDVDPAGYAALLRVASERLRETCPEAVVVGAALAQTTEPGGRNMDDLAYLQALYDAGWQPDFDVLAAQGFGLWTGPLDRRASAGRANFARVQLSRDVMVRNGDAAKPVWITEMGWDSPPEDMPAPYGRVDEETRGRYTVQAYERMAAEWPWAGVGFLWFLRRPNFEWHSQPQGYFRLLEPDWAVTPSWTALLERARQSPVMERGRHGAWDVSLRYTGPWRDLPESGPLRARTGLPGAEVQFELAGTAFELLARAGEDRVEPARLTVVVDGGAREAALEPTEDGARLTAGIRGLENARHLAIVRVDAGTLTLEEVVVRAPNRGDPPLGAVLGLGVGALLLAALLGAGVGARKRRGAPAESA